MKSAKKSRVLAPKTSVQKAIAHRKIERKAAALTKLAEVAHQEYRAAKLVYKAAKKAARTAKAAWHRSRVATREIQRAMNKSAKRLARSKASATSPSAG